MGGGGEREEGVLAHCWGDMWSVLYPAVLVETADAYLHHKIIINDNSNIFALLYAPSPTISL
jgi:hypothetical protein